MTSGLAFHTTSALIGGSSLGREDLPETAHVQLPRQRAASQVVAFDRGRVDHVAGPGAHRAGQAAAAVAPRAGERRQAGHGAVEHRSVLVVLAADQRADRRWLHRAVHGGQALDLGGGHPARRCGTLRRPLLDVRRQVFEADGVGVDPVAVDEPVADEHVHHRQHQGDVGTRPGLHEPVGGLGGGRADRVDHHHLGTGGTGLLDVRPQMAVGELGVRGPQQDQLGVADLQRIEGPRRAVGHRHAGADSGSADGAQQAGAAESVPEALREGHRQQALVAGIAERHDRLGAVLGDDRVETRGDLRQCFVPRGRLEAAVALGADAAQRGEDPLRVVDPVDELVDLRAQFALGVGVRRVAAHLHGHPAGLALLDGDLPSAAVRAVVVTGSEHGRHELTVRRVPAGGPA